MQARMSRRGFLQVTGGVSLSTVLAGCFGVGGSSSGSGGGGGQSSTGTSAINVWDIRTGKEQQLIQDVTSKFNSQHSNIRASLEFFQADAYKQKIQVAMGAHHPPDIFFGWGGGILKSYIDAGDVYDMTSALNADSTWKNRYLPSVMQAATFGGKVYGVPNSGVQPVVFLYNKDLFEKYKVTPPQTWSELLSAVAKLKQNNVQPIALAGLEKWPYLMYEEYLVDRIGGPSALEAAASSQTSAWSNPAFIKANTMIQELVSAGAFGSNYASVSYNSGQGSALLYTGKAAMHLMGVWDFSQILSNSAAFIQNGKLGWFPFPAVEGGAGNASNLAGNLCNFYSITTASKSPQSCLAYLKDGILNEDDVNQLISLGDVPPVQGIDAKLSSAPHSDWLQFIYKSVQGANHYQLSWDQALPPQPAQALLTNLDLLFLKQISPQQFSDNMNKTITAK